MLLAVGAGKENLPWRWHDELQNRAARSRLAAAGLATSPSVSPRLTSKLTPSTRLDAADLFHKDDALRDGKVLLRSTTLSNVLVCSL